MRRMPLGNEAENYKQPTQVGHFSSLAEETSPLGAGGAFHAQIKGSAGTWRSTFAKQSWLNEPILAYYDAVCTIEEEEVGFDVAAHLKDVLFWDDGAWSRDV